LDVNNYEEVSHWIEDTVKKFGRLDGAANVAGIAGVKYHVESAQSGV